MTTGYTNRQAERIKRMIDTDIAAIETRVAKLNSRVTDHTFGGYLGQQQLEEFREIGEELKAIVDRRTRQ